MMHGQARQTKITLLDRGVGIAGILKGYLADKEIVKVDNIQEAIRQQSETSSDTLLCSLLLSHSTSADDCAETVAALARSFRNIAFFEPSAYGADYLASLGLKSFHTGFRSNRFMRSVTVDFLIERTPAFAITHFGCNAAFDSKSPWIVPADYPEEVFPKPGVVSDMIEFRFPVYEYSCFLYASFDSPQLHLDDDLYFIEKKIRKSPMQASGFDPRNWTLLKDAGVTEYTTGADGHPPDTRDIAAFTGRCHVDASAPIGHAVESKWISNIPPGKFQTIVNRLENCIVMGTGAVVTDGKLVAESNYLLQLMYGANAIREGMRRPHPTGHVNGLAIIAINSVSFNYYHWLAQVMPFLDIANRIVLGSSRKDVTIVTGRTFPFHEEFISAMFEDFDNVSVISLKPTEFVTADVGLYSNVMSNAGPESIVVEQLSLARRLKAAVVGDGGPASRLLYIARTDTRARRIANEQELIDQLRNRGFEILTLSKMSIKDQITAFSQARVVIGGHGAGMANILFSSGQTHLIELQNPSYTNNCMLRLAQNIGAEHTVKFFFSDDPALSRRDDWLVDIGQVMRMLDGILSDATCAPAGADPQGRFISTHG